MPDASSLRLDRVAKWGAIVALIGLLLAAAAMGEPGNPGWWLLALPIVAFQFGPILLAAACAHASPSRPAAFVFLGLAVAFVAFTAFIHVEVMRSASSTAALGLLFYPLPEYVAWVVVFTVASIFGWRHREDWLRN